ncbi:MAG: prevent-host-death family protein [Herminiimonas sp.]|nr:prevent-host-death family protein [Herminiimonas sp.]
MRKCSVYEAKTRLAALIKQVQNGERITITVRGDPVADLVPSERRAVEQARVAISAIKALGTALSTKLRSTRCA